MNPHPKNLIIDKQATCFLLSLIIGISYGLVYWRHELGVSPFHFSARLPGLDVIILLVTVIAPLVVGIFFGCLAGRLRWYVLPLYPIVIAMSLL